MSTDDDTARDALTTLGVGPAAKELYVDLLRPAARETGKNLLTVAKLVTLALTPLHGMVWGLEKIRDWLSTALLKRLATADPEQIQTPAPYVAGQILLQLMFCADQEQLREMYANLLASAMNKQFAESVHPAFVHVIQQITPDEALVLQRISTQAEHFALQETEIESGFSKGTPSISAQFLELCESAGLRASALSDTYLDNLLRLKVLVEQQWSEGTLHPDGHTIYGDYRARIENKHGRVVELSAFGRAFLRTCVTP